MGTNLRCVALLHLFFFFFKHILIFLCVFVQRCARVGPCPSRPSPHPRLGGSVSSRCPAGQADPRLGSFPSQRAATTIRAHFSFLEMRFLPKSGSPALLLHTPPPPLLPELTGVFCEDRFGFSLIFSPLLEKKPKSSIEWAPTCPQPLQGARVPRAKQRPGVGKGHSEDVSEDGDIRAVPSPNPPSWPCRLNRNCAEV